MPSAELMWIELTDFSPGIFSNNNLAGGLNVTSTNLALASPTNTYRCRALPTGGLGPLPRMKEAFQLTTPPTTGGAPLSDTYIINGLGTWGQAIADTNANTNEDHRIEVHLLLSWTYGTNDHAAAWIREHIYETTSPFTETIYSDTAAAADTLQYQYAYFLKTRMNPLADVADPGELVMVCVYTPPSQDLFINRVAPDPATPTTSATVELLNGDSEIYRKAVAHQGRVVVGRFAIYGRGVDTTNSANENFIYTNVNNYEIATGLTEAQVYVPEIDQNITDMASMSANQLIVVKDMGGGYVLTGDLDDVTVVRLPNLMSPDGTTTISGTQTPRGWVYSAGDRGLYLWNGGDQSEPLSAQIDARAFTAGLEGENAGHAGSCDRWLDLLLVPNLYVCDLESRSWWRLDNPDDYPSPMAFYSAAKYRGQMISARQELIDPPAATGTDNAFYLWEYDDLAHSYSWQSHPIWISRDRYMEVRQGIIAIEGAGQVTVTVVDVADNTNQSQQVIDVDTDVIRNYRFDVGLRAENLTIRLEANGDANGNDAVAPTIHRLFLGWRPAQSLANANN